MQSIAINFVRDEFKLFISGNTHGFDTCIKKCLYMFKLVAVDSQT